MHSRFRPGLWLVALAACEPADPAAPNEPPPPDALITPNEEFFVLQIGAVPEVDPGTWRLTIDGAVDRSAEISLFDLHALGARVRMETLVCGGANPTWPSIGNAIWGGRPLTELLATFGVTIQSEAIEMHVFAADGYTVANPIEDLTQRDIWLVWEMNGVPLPPEHGYPARLIVSDVLAAKSVKWPTRITFGTEHLVDHNEENYPDHTDPTIRPLCLFTAPAMDAELPRTPTDLEGNAFCGAPAVTRVEVSADDAQTWQDAEITWDGAPNVWTLWRHRWTPERAGAYTLLVRIECADGRESDPEGGDLFFEWDGYGWVDVVVR